MTWRQRLLLLRPWRPGPSSVAAGVMQQVQGLLMVLAAGTELQQRQQQQVDQLG